MVGFAVASVAVADDGDALVFIGVGCCCGCGCVFNTIDDGGVVDVDILVVKPKTPTTFPR